MTQEEHEVRTLLDEAVAGHEAAKSEFEALQVVIRKILDAGLQPPAGVALEDERARARLFTARVKLSRRQHPSK